MQGNDLIFAIQDKDFRFWKPDGANNAVISSTPYFLKFAPTGWEDYEIDNVINKKYWCIDRKVTVQAAYVQDGAQILKNIFYKMGIKEDVYLVMAQQQIDYTPGVEYGYWYKQIFRGQIDLSTFQHDGSKVTCTSLEDGLPKYLKANENTVLEIPMSDSDAGTVKLDGVTLHSQSTFVTIDEAITATSFTTKYVPITYFNTITDNSNTNLIFNNILKTELFSIDYSTSDLNFLEATDDVDLTINVKDFTFNYIEVNQVGVPANASYVRVYIKDQNGVTLRTLYTNESLPSPPASVTINDTFDLSLTAGDKLFFVIELKANLTSTVNLFESVHTYDSSTRFATTYIKAFTLQTLFNRLIPFVTENTFFTTFSSYLESISGVVLTCGNGIRGLEDAVMKISLANFFQFLDSVDSVGLRGANNYVGIDKKENLVDLVNYIDLPAPAYRPKISFAKEYFFNELEIGYPEIKNDIGVLNGNEEFNCKYNWSTTATLNPAKVDKVSKVKASCYEIEKIRITTFQKDTTDAKNDNDLYALHISNTVVPESGIIPAHFELDRTLNIGATGIIDTDTIFNLFLSPKRNLLRNGSFIRSCLYKCDSMNLLYRTADKNNKVVADSLIEKADVNIGSLDDIFFYPLLVEADFNVPFDLIESIDSNPKQVFRFPFQGNYFKGFLVKGSISPSSRKAQTFQLMLTADNDINKLIEYFG